MGYHLTFELKDGYLHAKVTGANTKENVQQYLDEILHHCKTTQSTRLLIEEQLEGPRLNTAKVFEIAAEGSARALGFFQAIAFVDINASGDLMQFAETVAKYRAVPVKVFATVAEAEQWLSSNA